MENYANNFTVNTNSSETTDQVQTQPSKVDVVLENVGAFFKRVEKGIKPFIRFSYKLGKEINRLIRGCVNFAVKLSIIMIALILLNGYIKANPAEWANIVTTFQNAFESVKNSFANAISSMFWFM